MANAHLVVQVNHTLNDLVEDPFRCHFDFVGGLVLSRPQFFALVNSDIVYSLISFEVFAGCVQTLLDLAMVCQFHHQVHLVYCWIVKQLKYLGNVLVSNSLPNIYFFINCLQLITHL